MSETTSLYVCVYRCPRVIVPHRDATFSRSHLGHLRGVDRKVASILEFLGATSRSRREFARRKYRYPESHECPILKLRSGCFIRTDISSRSEEESQRQICLSIASGNIHSTIRQWILCQREVKLRFDLDFALLSLLSARDSTRSDLENIEICKKRGKQRFPLIERICFPSHRVRKFNNIRETRYCVTLAASRRTCALVRRDRTCGDDGFD